MCDGRGTPKTTRAAVGLGKESLTRIVFSNKREKKEKSLTNTQRLLGDACATRGVWVVVGWVCTKLMWPPPSTSLAYSEQLSDLSSTPNNFIKATVDIREFVHGVTGTKRYGARNR